MVIYVAMLKNKQNFENNNLWKLKDIANVYVVMYAWLCILIPPLKFSTHVNTY